MKTDVKNHRCMSQIFMLTLLSTLFFLAVFGSVQIVAAQQEEPKRGGVLYVGLGNRPPHLNPAIQSGIYTGTPGVQLFASLLRIDRNWNYFPYLAERWEIAEDGLSVTFHLRAGATFHDDAPITAVDVAFSILTVQQYHPFSAMLAAVERVDTPDPLTAVVRLKQPHPALLLVAASPMLPILPKHIYGDGQDIKTHPANWKVVGSGPFHLKAVKENEIVLQRYDRFFLPGKPYLDEIVVKILNDATIQVAFETGAIHLYGFNSNVPMVQQLAKRSELLTEDKSYAGIGPLLWLAFNLRKPPFDDLRVRQAIAYTIDREFLVKTLYQGMAKVATGPISPDTPFYTDQVEQYEVNIARANELLDEAGYVRDAKGVRFSTSLLFFPFTGGYVDIAEYLRSELLRKIGIDLQLIQLNSFPEWVKRVANWEFDLTLDYVFNWGDPVIGVHRTYASDNIRKGVIWSNTQGYSNPEVDALMQQAGTEMNFERRRALYTEFQHIVARELPVYWLARTPNATIYHRNLTGLGNTIWGNMFPYDEIYWKE